MGVDFFNCEDCGQIIPDCGMYDICSGCGLHFCDSCGGIEDDSCIVCRYDVISDSQILHYVLKHYLKKKKHSELEKETREHLKKRRARNE